MEPTGPARVERRLAAILAADVAGYSRLMGEDEEGTLAARLEGLAEPGSICVSGRVHADALGKVDVAFDDLGEQSLKNIARPLRVFAARIGGAGAKITSVEKLPLPLPDKPSIAVLPFANMSGDPDQEYFADGMVEEIITALSKMRWFFVIG